MPLSSMNAPRTRTYIVSRELGRFVGKYIGPEVEPNPYTDVIPYYFIPRALKEEITDSRHPNPKYAYKKPLDFQDSGGPLLVRRIEKRNNFASAVSEHSSGTYPSFNSFEQKYSGGITAGEWGESLSGTPYTQSELQAVLDAMTLPVNPMASVITAIGTKGIKEYSPTKPRANLAQFVGELSHLPQLPLQLAHRSESFLAMAGGEYLNVQFGWLPFVNDLLSMLIAYRDFEKNLRQLQRDSGRAVRRKGNIGKKVVTTSVSKSPAGYYANPIMTTQHYASLVKDKRTTSVETCTDYRFSGRFKYFLGPIGSIGYEEQINRILLGVDLTPRLVWELIPWSWLVDWIANVGDAISNAVSIAEDSLLIEYAYATGFYTRKTTVSVTTSRGTVYGALFSPTPGSGQVHCTMVTKESVLQRIQATPYGFGITLTGLTTTQQAILAALGFSRFL